MTSSRLSIHAKFLLAALVLWCVSLLLVTRVISASKGVIILCLFGGISFAMYGTTEKNRELGRVVGAMCWGLYIGTFIYLQKLQGFLFWMMLAMLFVLAWVFARNSYKAVIKLRSGAYRQSAVSSDAG